MLAKYIVDDDLKKYYPKLASYLWTGSTDYSTQIGEAFETVLDELRARDIDARKLHIPIDVNRDYDSTTDQNVLTSLTKTTSGNGSKYAYGLQGFRRFIAEVTATSGTGTPTMILSLQGSNEQIRIRYS